MNDKSKHHNFIHTTYQMVFVIYAPVALFSILIKTFSDTYVSYFFLTSMMIAALSIAIGIAMCVQFWRHRKAIRQDDEKHIPYLVRHRFVIIYIPIAIGSMLISSYYIFDKYVKAVEFYDAGQYQQISILFPIHDTLGVEMEDSKQVKLALGAFLIKYPQPLEKYHFNIFDHRNKYSEDLEQYVISQMKKGTQYFVCAYSDVCSQLGNNFEDLQNKADRVAESVIVTTLSSSMQLPLQKNQFYRFFVRNKEEANALALYAFNQGIKTASFIAADDAYGHDAVEQFQESWEDFGGKFIAGMFVDPSVKEDVVKAQLSQAPLIKAKPQAIFIAYYENINIALELIDKETTLLFSSNYQQNNIKQLVTLGVDQENLIVALPSYKVAHQALTNTPGTFIYMTLEKLILADIKAEGDLKKFHHYWQQEEMPNFLQFKRDGDADFKVSVEAVPYRKDLHNQLQ